VTEHWNKLARDGVSIHQDAQKLSGHGSGQPAISDPAREGGSTR